MTRIELNQAGRLSIEDRLREGIKAILEQVMEKEMDHHLQAKHRERTDRRRGERNGHYSRGLTTNVGHLEQIRVPRSREGEFLTEVFDRYRRMMGSMEAAVLEMYLQGISSRKVEQITGKLSGVKISKDAVSRTASTLDETLSEWRTQRLDTPYPCLYLDATYLKARWAGSVRDIDLLVVVGVSEEGFREVLAVEAAPGKRRIMARVPPRARRARSLGRAAGDLRQPSIQQAVKVELPGAAWQRCVVHVGRNVLAHVPQTETKSMAADLKVIFRASRRETAEVMAAGFAERYSSTYPKAVATLSRGLNHALTYTAFPSSHHRLIRTKIGWSGDSGR